MRAEQWSHIQFRQKDKFLFTIYYLPDSDYTIYYGMYPFYKHEQISSESSLQNMSSCEPAQTVKATQYSQLHFSYLIHFYCGAVFKSLDFN